MTINHAAPKRQTAAYWQAAAESTHSESEQNLREKRQDDSAKSILELMNNASTPTESIHQQEKNHSKRRKRKTCNGTSERTSNKTTKEKQKHKRQKPKEQQGLPTIIEIDSGKGEIQPTQTINNSLIKQEKKEREEMSEDLPNNITKRTFMGRPLC